MVEKAAEADAEAAAAAAETTQAVAYTRSPFSST